MQGCDCLGLIKYFDAHFTNFHGGVETIENCVCMHEEDHGVSWKHQDWRTGSTEVRRSRRLTVSFFCTVANYEYGFYWHFYQVWFSPPFPTLACQRAHILSFPVICTVMVGFEGWAQMIRELISCHSAKVHSIHSWVTYLIVKTQIKDSSYRLKLLSRSR